MSYNTSQQASMQIIPYYLIFKRDLKLSIKETVLINATILNKVIVLIYKVFLF